MRFEAWLRDWSKQTTIVAFLFTFLRFEVFSDSIRVNDFIFFTHTVCKFESDNGDVHENVAEK